MNLLAPLRQRSQLSGIKHSLLAGVLAILMGLGIAFIPMVYLFIGFVVLAIGIACLFSPIAMLAFLMILSPMRVLIATESDWPLPFDIGLTLLPLFFLSVFGHYIRAQRTNPASRISPFSPNVIWLAWFIFIVGVGLSSLTTASFTNWLNEIIKWLIVGLMMLCTVYLGRTYHIWWFIVILVCAGLANAGVGLYIFLGGSGADHLVINQRFFRAFGTFGQPNPFGGFMGLLIPISLTTAVYYSLKMWRSATTSSPIGSIWSTGYWWLATALLVAGLIVSWSRGAWLATIASVAVITFAMPRKLWQSITMSLLAGSIVALIWFSGVLPSSITDRLASSTAEFFAFDDVRGVDITSDNYAVVERLAHWQAAVDMATHNPWSGVGFGNYELAYEAYRLINWPEPLGHAHNYYLNIFAEAGIIGILSFLALWLTILRTTWMTRYHPDEGSRWLSVGLLGSWVYLLSHSFLDNLFVNNLFLHIGLMFGLLSMMYNQLEKNIYRG